MAKYELTMRDEQTREKITIDAESLESAEQQATEETRDWVEGGDWGDEGASVSAWWTLYDEDGDEVADGSVTVEIAVNEDAIIPETDCGDTVDDHEWTSEGMGGCDKNPGVWSLGGTAMLFKERCIHCGLVRIERTTGSQRNPGEHDTVEFEMGDE